MAQKVLAVDDNLVNLKLVSATLTHAGYEVVTAKSGPEALDIVTRVGPDIIILDVMMPMMDGYEVCRRMRKNPAIAHLPIMMLTAHDSLEEKIKGFEAGADEYLTKPFQPAELLARVKVQLRRVSVQMAVEQTEIQSRNIAVFSLRGGVGVSSMATNLAAGLNQIWNLPVALVDLALTIGQSALMLNVPLKNTWADLKKVAEEDLDIDMLRQIMIQHPTGISVLASPSRPEQSEFLTATKVAKTFQALHSHFHYIVMDLPHDFRDTTLAGLDAADLVVVMLAPELASVRAAACALETFETLGYAKEKTVLALNWTFERRGLARKDIETALKKSIDLVVPFAPETFVTAINFGTPPIIESPNTPIGALLEDFVFMISKEEHQTARLAAPSEAWRRVTDRIQQRQQHH